MSGHSKWSTIKRKKEKTDAARGRVFTRLIKEITIAARNGGGDEESNPRLRTAVLAAKAANMPATNIDRAVKRGTGELPGVVYEEIVLRRVWSRWRSALYRNTDRQQKPHRRRDATYAQPVGGSLGESGSVAWMFNKKGIITVPAAGISEDNLMEATLEAGVDDIQMDNDYFTLTCAPNDLKR
jgi:YebC/PmpR family DNA-binding regulatory protein